MVEQNFTQQTNQMIDNLKDTSHQYGLVNRGDENKIIKQVSFLLRQVPHIIPLEGCRRTW